MSADGSHGVSLLFVILLPPWCSSLCEVPFSVPLSELPITAAPFVLKQISVAPFVFLSKPETYFPEEGTAKLALLGRLESPSLLPLLAPPARIKPGVLGRPGR